MDLYVGMYFFRDNFIKFCKNQKNMNRVTSDI